MLDFGHLYQFLPFLLGLRRQCTPMALQTDLLALTVFILGIENMIYKLLSNIIAHWQGLTVAKMGFCHFLLFFCHLRVHSQPLHFQQFIISLESHPHPTKN